MFATIPRTLNRCRAKNWVKVLAVAILCSVPGLRAQPNGGGLVPGVGSGPAPTRPNPGPAAGPAQGNTAVVFELPTQGQNAEEAFRRAAQALPQKLGQGVQWKSAFADRQGQFMEGFFEAKDKGGQLVKGAMLVVGGSSARVLLDYPPSFGRSHTQFIRAAIGQNAAQGGGGVGGAGAQRPPQLLPLQPANFGTGSIGLPQGWRVLGSFQGCVEAAAENVGYISLGCAEFAAVPGAYPDPRVFQHPYAPLPTMLTAWLTRKPAPGMSEVRILESAATPSPVPNGQAAYFLFDYMLDPDRSGQLKPFRGFILFHIMPTDNHTYTVYKSMVLLQRSKFEDLFPTMWASWNSWSVNPAVFKERMDAAVASMRETSRIIASRSPQTTGSGGSGGSAGGTGTVGGFGEYIRGVATLEDTLTRERQEADQTAADIIVRANPDRFRIVTISR